jgi:hypothetical protein
MGADATDALISVLLAAGVGFETVIKDLDDAETKLKAAETKLARHEAAERSAVRNLAQLDRLMLTLYNLAEELNERGGKVNGPKIAARIHAIREGGTK